MKWGVHDSVPWEGEYDTVVGAYRFYDKPVMVTNSVGESYEGTLTYFSDGRAATLHSNGATLVVGRVIRIELSND